jgi:hypothetical protein
LSSEVPFWNSAEYGILYGIAFISRNSAKKCIVLTVQYREIPRNSILVCVYGIPYTPSNENSIIKKLKKSTKGMVYAVEFRGIP